MNEQLKFPDTLLDEGINSQAKIIYEEFLRQLNLQDKAFKDFKDKLNEIVNTITDPTKASATILCNEVVFVSMVLKFFSEKFHEQVVKMYESGELFDKKLSEINKALEEREQ